MTTFRVLSLSLAALLAGPGVATLPAASETWTNLDGQTMQAECLGRQDDQVSFRKDDGTRYLYPYAKLTEADRARVDAAPPAKVPSTPAAPAAALSAPAGRLTSALADKLVSLQGPALAKVSPAQLAPVRFVALYYSAHWCGPCRRFTPELVTAYKEIKAAHPEFELVFVSNDEDADKMKGYMQEAGMPWLALRYDAIDSTRAVARPERENGIPNLVFLTADGRELSTSFDRKGEYLGPQKVLGDIRAHFKM